LWCNCLKLFRRSPPQIPTDKRHLRYSHKGKTNVWKTVSLLSLSKSPINLYPNVLLRHSGRSSGH
jgi:hypothetical protein